MAGARIAKVSQDEILFVTLGQLRRLNGEDMSVSGIGSSSCSVVDIESLVTYHCGPTEYLTRRNVIRDDF